MKNNEREEYYIKLIAPEFLVIACTFSAGKMSSI
jgi:hypothetical protein